MTKPIVALVGRPNVGKSTLFNRLVGRRVAVVSDIAGTTRDRLYAEAEWVETEFIVVDTGGLEFSDGWQTAPLSEDSERFLPAIRTQAAIAIQDADLIIQVVDGTVGVTAADIEIAEVLRKAKKTIFIAVNKLESHALHINAYEFYELGLGELYAISALHGTGTGDLLDAIIENLPKQTEKAEPLENEDSIKIALLGRPNVGKSTLLNKLVGHERSIVSPIAGTTRDAIDTQLIWQGQPFTLIDTAGIRRRGKIDPEIEKYSVLRALKALKRADIALILIDINEGITAQDTHVAGMIAEEKTSVIILVNKWDALVKDSYTIHEVEKNIRESFQFLPYAPILFISAQTGQRVHTILPEAVLVNEARYQRIPTGELNRIMRDAVAAHPPPNKGALRIKFFYATQVTVAPPTFVFFVNKPEAIHFSYQRYIENKIREQTNFHGTPINIFFRARSEDRFNKKKF